MSPSGPAAGRPREGRASNEPIDLASSDDEAAAPEPVAVDSDDEAAAPEPVVVDSDSPDSDSDDDFGDDFGPPPPHGDDFDYDMACALALS